jgi:transcription elongation factor GreA-like protein
MSRQLTIEEVYKIIEQVENESIRNLLQIAYGQLREEYEFDKGWKEANLPDLLRLDKRVKELEAAIEPFAAYYKTDCTNLDPDYCVISEADEEENNLTVGLFRAAYKVLEGK